ncbi:MAG: RAD55 family ATPase [Candidatus Nanohalobium sp.]
MAEVERITTGIEGLDDLIQGGFPKSSVTLISGGTGTGKTTLCNQFLMEGIEKGQKALYISTEEPVEAIKDDAAVFDWDLRKHEEEGVLRMEYSEPSENQYLSGQVKQLLNSGEYDRVVLDSMSVFTTYWGDKFQIRRNLQDLVKMLRKSDSTVIMTAEIPEDSENSLSRSKVSEFVADGVVALYYESMGEGSFRNIEVRKMRRTDNTPGTHPIEITDDGMSMKEQAGF